MTRRHRRPSTADPSLLESRSVIGHYSSLQGAQPDSDQNCSHDLWALGEAGMIDRAAVDLFGRLGTYTSALKVPFARIPSDAEWEAALGHQGIIRVGPRDAAHAVWDAIRGL